MQQYKVNIYFITDRLIEIIISYYKPWDIGLHCLIWRTAQLSDFLRVTWATEDLSQAKRSFLFSYFVQMKGNIPLQGNN